MSDWQAIRMTQARQVAELVGLDEDALPAPDLSARAHYAALRASGELADALDFIAHAMPRLEAVSWAAHLLDGESRTRLLPLRDRQALDHALRWLGDPDDGNRRAAYDAAMEAGERSPERMLGFAVFFSGGSISLADLPPVLPPAEASSRFAVGAVHQATLRADDPQALLTRALDLAEAVAARGVGALAAA